MGTVRTKHDQRRRFARMASELKDRIGRHIAARREELGLTQDEVARALPGKITGSVVSKWERGIQRPNDDNLDALGVVLGVEPSYFFMPAPKDETASLMSALTGRNTMTGDIIGERLARIEATLEDLKQLVETVLVQSPGELGRIVGDDPPTAPRPAQSETDPGMDAQSDSG